jgi:hypothetical protein
MEEETISTITSTICSLPVDRKSSLTNSKLGTHLTGNRRKKEKYPVSSTFGIENKFFDRKLSGDKKKHKVRTYVSLFLFFIMSDNYTTMEEETISTITSHRM